MKKHFVTGGTGFIGRHLVRALLKKGDKVYMLVRPEKNLSPQHRIFSIFGEHKQNITIIPGDIREKNLGIKPSIFNKLRREKINFVWHLAANLAFNQSMKDYKRFKANVKGTENVVDLTNEINSVLCHCSTAYVCGDSKNYTENSLDEGQKFRNIYELTKYLGEKVVREKCKVPYIIFRPSLVIDKPTPGKASNCTFGYYRYIFMFFLFRKWLLKSLSQGKFTKLLLKILGTRLDKNGKAISIPLLFLPFPKNIKVNMISIDYVVEDFLKISQNKSAYNKTYHLTHPNPRTFIFMMKILINDLSLKSVKYVGVSPWIFNLMFKLLYFLAIPWRGYLKSALMYAPYITTSPNFARQNVTLYNSPPKTLKKDYFNKINKEAIEQIFPKIQI